MQIPDTKEARQIDAAMTNPLRDELARAVVICPQCEGEGGYPDGLDEAACHTDCTRCEGAGWLVDLAFIDQHYIPRASLESEEMVEQLGSSMVYQAVCISDEHDVWDIIDTRYGAGSSPVEHTFPTRGAAEMVAFDLNARAVLAAIGEKP